MYPMLHSHRDEVDVDVEGLTDTDLDYGIDLDGLASLRQRAMRTINMYLGMWLCLYVYVCVRERFPYTPPSPTQTPSKPHPPTTKPAPPTAARTEYISYVKRAFELDSICRARATRDYIPPDGHGTANAVRWRYKCLAKPWVQRGTAVVLALLSGAVVWSEATIGLGKDPDVSPFSIV